MAKFERACWEQLDCPEERKSKCPAFTEKRGGECWKVPGTLCRGELQGTMAQKIGTCRNCNFYCSSHRVKISVGVKIMGGFAILIAIFLAMGIFGLYQMRLIAALNNYDISDVQRLFGLTMFASVLIAGSVGWFVTRAIAKPIKEMEEVAGRVASGDLSVNEIKINTGDEISLLATAFNEMVESLKDIAGQLREKAEHVASAAEQLSSSSQQITASANEAASTMIELSSTVEQVTENTQIVASASEDAAKHAEAGTTGINQVTSQMKNIGTSTGVVGQSIERLSTRSGEISQIVELITQIADQTNLLALNAAIEAARAGEQGKGFAVVAEEVRKLAERSGSAAKEIKTLIETIQEEAQNAVQTMAASAQEVEAGNVIVIEVGTNFNNIITTIQKLSQQLQDLAAATEQMSAGIQNVASNTEEQTATMEEVTASADTLSKMAVDLEDIAERFKL
ncbi:methyl-accepting chemotaxis sensory transducer [Desulforamulus reducens MI-1]|uniref:Methyl-accepting chemotaxis sensory transducer n=1 Tax=Desulforamulus reducens (strain ATCC BAA-1160 / DSM 100696 / MI-1) TaxID=349161 RepID=A4J838_DESRM|nr:methyl-accepting chemotaxis protein [Desulforamulus reducens]ABO51241.1 methyl-accepting chemotaxis sensory transducer [Desulforamulus reducens MI-1]